MNNAIRHGCLHVGEKTRNESPDRVSLDFLQSSRGCVAHEALYCAHWTPHFPLAGRGIISVDIKSTRHREQCLSPFTHCQLEMVMEKEGERKRRIYSNTTILLEECKSLASNASVFYFSFTIFFATNIKDFCVLY